MRKISAEIKKEVDLGKIFNFLRMAGKLKNTLRYTTTANGRRESVAEHSYRLALMVVVLNRVLDLKIDLTYALKIALVHDLGEIITGDIDAVKIGNGEITRKEKEDSEWKAMRRIKVISPDGIGDEIYQLWQDYEQKITDEAKLIKALDKLETLTSIVEAGYKTYDAPELIPNYADNAVKDFPILENILKLIKKELKKEFRKGKVVWLKSYEDYP